MSDNTIRIVLIENNQRDARLMSEMLNAPGSHSTELTHVVCLSDAEKHLASHAVDIVLLDPDLPDAQGMGAVQRAHAAAPRVPLVVLTGLDDESLAAQSLQEGAQDYLIKDQIETRGLMRALRHAIERKRLERLKDEFVSTVSHELRTPLTSISGSLGLLLGQWAGKLPEPAAHLLAIAHKNSQRLGRLIDDILDIEKIDAGRAVFNLSRVEVRPLVEHTIEGNRGFAESYGVRIRLDAASADGAVNADPDRLAQVITNLLSNAIKFSPAGGEVLVAVEQNGDVLRMSVRDHGPGVPADFRPRIFEKFAQADATNARQKGGTGLGLSIAKQIVERLGGEVGFEDARDGGTIFCVELPVWDGTAKRPRILHVDDDPDVLATVTDALRTTADVVSVNSIERARSALATERIDLAVLDILLGADSGLDLLPDLRNDRGHVIPVIIFSAHTADLACGEQVHAALAKSRTSLDNLVATVRDRLPPLLIPASEKVA